jgi:hypothetical protein
MDAETDSKVSRIRERLEDHPHFRGRTHLLQVEAIGRSIVVSGRLPSYYLKQLLQEAIKAIPGVVHIDNRVDVTFEQQPHTKPWMSVPAS